MASYTVLPAQPTGLQKGMDSANDLLGDYVRTMLAQKVKDQFSSKQDMFNDSDIASLMKDPRFAGMKQKVSYGENGPQFSAESVDPKDSTPDFDKALKHIAIGAGTPDEVKAVSGRVQIPEQTEMVPGMSMPDGSTGMIPQPKPVDQEAIRSFLFPGYSQQQAAADVVGLPQAKEVKPGLSDSFKQDFKAAIVSANDDENTLVKGLHNLLIKYADDPVAIKHINDLLTANKKTQSQEDESDPFAGANTWK